MTSGDLAARAGVHKETLRFYEREGLLPEPMRTSGGYRDFSDNDLKRVVFIRNAQKFGFGLKEIRDLLAIADGDLLDRARIREIARQKVQLIDEQIAWLTLMRDTMEELIHRCARSRAPHHCPIIDRLAQGIETPADKEGVSAL